MRKSRHPHKVLLKCQMISFLQRQRSNIFFFFLGGGGEGREGEGRELGRAQKPRKLMTDVGSLYLIDYRKFLHLLVCILQFVSTCIFCEIEEKFSKLTSRLYAQEELLYIILSHFSGDLKLCIILSQASPHPVPRSHQGAVTATEEL